MTSTINTCFDSQVDGAFTNWDLLIKASWLVIVHVTLLLFPTLLHMHMAFVFSSLASFAYTIAMTGLKLIGCCCYYYCYYYYYCFGRTLASGKNSLVHLDSTNFKLTSATMAIGTSQCSICTTTAATALIITNTQSALSLSSSNYNHMCPSFYITKNTYLPLLTLLNAIHQSRKFDLALLINAHQSRNFVAAFFITGSNPSDPVWGSICLQCVIIYIIWMQTKADYQIFFFFCFLSIIL